MLVREEGKAIPLRDSGFENGGWNRMKSMKRAAWLSLLTGLYLLLLLSLWGLNRIGPEKFWFGAFNLYLPQIMWAIPGILLAVVICRVDRSWAWLPVLCVLFVLGPVMDFHWPFREPEPTPGRMPLRIMTWNTKYSPAVATELQREISRCNPDILLFQDAPGALKGPLGTYLSHRWNVLSRGQYVIASRYPLSGAEVIELPFSSRRKDQFVRCRMLIGSQVISLYNVHFRTPRRSLNAFRTAKRRSGSLPEAIESLEDNVKIRINQAAVVQGYLNRETGPVILAGDLNAPDASLACKALRDAGLRDAFAAAGRGYGFTYGHRLLENRLPWLRFSWMRIDHIMLTSQFQVRRCVVGTGVASDHRPVIADLNLKNAEERTDEKNRRETK